MPIIPPSGQKHDLSGIGGASAAAIMALLAANPSTTALTVGLGGKIVFWILSKFFSVLSSMGLVLLNVGAERLQVALDKAGFDGSFDDAEKIMEAIRNTGRDLTPEEIKSIDDKVIVQFRKFGRIGRRK